PCSPPSRTLRAAQARWPSAILDRGCARTPWGRQAGTKKRPSSAEPRNIPGGVSPLLRQGLGSLNPCQTARRQLEQRFAQCGLMLHPGKTQIVYCKDNQRRGCHSNQKFDFLGYTFRPRLAMNRWGKTFVNFSPGTSNRAAQAIRQTMREWQLDCRIDKRIDDLAKMFNPIIRGWINYYGRYHKSALSRALMHLDIRLAGWAMSKYRRLRGH